MKTNIIEDKKFYKLLLIIAIPVIIQNLISLSLNMVDTIMIGKLGVNPLASVGIANRVYYIFSMICFGLFSGSSIFIAQYWGVKDIHNIRKVFGTNVSVGAVLSIVFTIIVWIFPRPILSLFSNDNDVLKEGIIYLRITSISYLFTALSFAASFNSRAIHRLKVPTIINAVAIIANTLLNYILIYGKLSFPKLGVTGAAIATTIARIIEFALMYLYIYLSKEHPLAGTIKELLSWDFKTLKELLKTSLPVIISESSYGLGTTVYYIAYGMLGPSAIAIVQVTFIINDLFQSVFIGLGNATSVMLGNEIGQDNLETAKKYSNKFINITMILNVIVTVALILVRNIISNIYDFDYETSIMLKKCIIVFALFTSPKMLNYLFICGVLRSGGDTRYPMIAELITIWCISVPLAFLSVIVFKFPLHLVLVCSFSEELIKFVIVYRRYKTMKWLNNIIS